MMSNRHCIACSQFFEIKDFNLYGWYPCHFQTSILQGQLVDTASLGLILRLGKVQHELASYMPVHDQTSMCTAFTQACWHQGLHASMPCLS